MTDDATHVIRLHGPYECGTHNAECGTDVIRSRVKVPLDFGDLLPADFIGTVTLERAFGLPTNLDDQQQIQLVIHLDGPTIGQVTLNDVTLTNSSETPGVFCADAGTYLRNRNRMVISAQFDSSPNVNASQSSLSEVSIRILG